MWWRFGWVLLAIWGTPGPGAIGRVGVALSGVSGWGDFFAVGLGVWGPGSAFAVGVGGSGSAVAAGVGGSGPAVAGYDLFYRNNFNIRYSGWD